MISGKTQLAGLIGWPVSHSFSPAMHNAAAAELGLDLVYVPLPVRLENLPAAIRGLAALGFVGVNVTVPHKEAVIPLLSEVDTAAHTIGAVNTISFQPPAAKSQQSAVSGQQSAVGHNTDAAGFLADLEHIGVAIAGRECLILGAGGSARAVAYGLASAGGTVRLFARRVEQARKLAADLLPHFEAARFSAFSWEELKETRDFQETLIVNTTPLGMTPEVDLSPWPDTLHFPPKAVVYDLVYNPSETRLVAQARAAGCRAANGLGMLLRQGALAFELWTGREPDIDVMRATLPHF
jgi:shikimate dehydrogenase